MVIWTVVLDHGKSHISFCRSGMNYQKKAVSFQPERTVLLVPTLDFAHGRPSAIVLGTVWQVRSAATVAFRFGCPMTSAFANAAAQV
jgi:hypothetical protein